MNKVVLMGRLTRDPEVRYTEEITQRRLRDIHSQSIENSREMENRLQTLYAVSYLERLLNLQRNTYREA